MTTSIKITSLTNIGANIAYTTLVPVVNMAGTPETQKANLQIVGNLILSQAGGANFAPAAQATLALSVANANQPNITAIGNGTSVSVAGNLTANGAFIANGNIFGDYFIGDGSLLTGLSSLQGLQGLIGAQGTTGNTGIQGTTGIQGIQGITGGTGIQGIQGIIGSQGITGTGIQGITGGTGIQGIQGTQSVQGLQGLQGSTGSGGTQGVAGSTGTQGVAGSTGTQGVAGSTGIQGINGIQGLQGIQSIQGLQGLQGLTGAILPIANGNSNINIANINGNVTITSNGAATWSFGSDGLLTLPEGAIIDTLGNNFEVRAIENVNFQANAVVNIYTDGSGNAYQWVFDDAGFTYLPFTFGYSNTGVITTVETGNISLLSGLSDFTFDTTGNVTIPRTLISSYGNQAFWAYSNIGLTVTSNTLSDVNGISMEDGIDTLVYANANTVIQSNVSGNINQWVFDNTGNLTLPGNISGNVNGYTIGYLNIPQVSASNTTLALSDAGKHYYSTTAGNITLTIPTNASIAFDTGAAISIVVQAAGNILVNAAAGVTLYMAGNSTAANRYVGAYGMATLMKVGTDTWFINGTGVN